ncbi:MAG: flavin reductase family protein [Eubacteriales bacterium]|nr:flavin reductase family protein [Eubacteriales bacterium]
MEHSQSFRPIGPTTYLGPIPALLVGCADENGKPNFFTAAWTGVCCTKPPMVTLSIKPERYSHDLIQRSGEFTLNLPDEALCRAVDYCGVKSGRDTDKLAVLGLHAVAAPPLALAPALAEAPAHLCCRVDRVLRLGSHDLFLARVEQVYVAERCFLPSGSIDESRMKLLGYFHGKYRAQGPELGFFGWSVAGDRALQRRKKQK